jgi:hypothetical protein
MPVRLYNLRDCFTKKKIIFCYSGPMSQDLMVEIGNTLKVKMQQEAFNRSVVAKTFAILVEQVQNIMHYSTEKTKLKSFDDARIGNGIVAVGLEDDRFYVASGNMIHAVEKEKISGMITKINSLNPDEKKQYYKEMRKKAPDETSRGAGLGFIEMARKSDHPVDFDFIDVDNEFCFFTIRLYI